MIGKKNPKPYLGNFYLIDLRWHSQSLTEKTQAFIPFTNVEFPPQIVCSILPTPQIVCPELLSRDMVMPFLVCLQYSKQPQQIVKLAKLGSGHPSHPCSPSFLLLAFPQKPFYLSLKQVTSFLSAYYVQCKVILYNISFIFLTVYYLYFANAENLLQFQKTRGRAL